MHEGFFNDPVPGRPQAASPARLVLESLPVRSGRVAGIPVSVKGGAQMAIVCSIRALGAQPTNRETV